MEYNKSQSLIEGQKQHPKETALVFSIKGKNGLTNTQTIHCNKFKILCSDMEWDVYQGAKVLGCTPGECLDIWEGIQPITEQMQTNMYKTIGIRLSTLRIDNDVKHLKNARQLRFAEIFEQYKDRIQPIKRKRSLLKITTPKQELDSIILSLTGYSHPLLGKTLKCFRAAKGDSQYSLADKVALNYPTKLPFCKREYWHNVETRNWLTRSGNMGFYRAYGMSVQQAITPFFEYLKDNDIKVEQDVDNASLFLDKIEFVI